MFSKLFYLQICITLKSHLLIFPNIYCQLIIKILKSGIRAKKNLLSMFIDFQKK